ncbi:Transposon Tf2-9 polyprotein [Labeo rohita]|uniref:Transposon Tf2-9 polyprotein n=1 Tax=Labeo rohita TaxID=84645 RepID=A0ABQ8MEH1_LABRO|nr:Transposon Tf2-9 polyprotein [Labeo rohita]
MAEHGYKAMPQVQQMLASYLFRGAALPSNPLHTTSALVGKGYMAAGQAGACLHTMAVLQTYQVDLLMELDEGKEVKSDASQNCIGPLICLSESPKRRPEPSDRFFFLNAPLAPSVLFGNSVNSIVDRFQEACKQAAVFQRFLPRCSPAPGSSEKKQFHPCTSSSESRSWRISVNLPLSPLTSFQTNVDIHISKLLLHHCKPPKLLRFLTITERRPASSQPPYFHWLLDCSTDLLLEQHETCIFSKLDLCIAYNLIWIHKGDEWQIAFITPSGHYEYQVMPYCLSKST